MAYPPNTLKYTLYGDRAGGEIWNTGGYIMGSGVTDQTSLAGVVAQIQLAASDPSSIFTAAGILPRWAPTTRWLGVRGYFYVSGDPKHADYAYDSPVLTPIVGSGTVTLPPQCALVTTLLTGAAGRRTRGRMYWPVDANGNGNAQMISTSVDNLVLSVETFLGRITNRVVGSSVHVVSNAGTSSRAVTEIKADSKIDIQRRRANKLAATYVKAVPLIP